MAHGFDRAFWTTRQAGAKLFRIGELEYEFDEVDPLTIHLHIPSDARLEAPLLNDSVLMMRKFMENYYPDRKNNPVSLESWLLSPALKELLSEKSHIRAFQAAFDITGYDPMPMDCLEWVFNIPGSQIDDVDLSALPDRTSLQRSIKQHLLDGGHIGNASGTLERPFT